MDSLEAKAAQLAKKVLSDAANKSNVSKNGRDIMFVRSDAKGGEKQTESGAVKNPDEINIDEDEDMSEDEQETEKGEKDKKPVDE
jgi:hypothetical protein